jgi:hypothetical protein
VAPRAGLDAVTEANTLLLPRIEPRSFSRINIAITFWLSLVNSELLNEGSENSADKPSVQNLFSSETTLWKMHRKSGVEGRDLNELLNAVALHCVNLYEIISLLCLLRQNYPELHSLDPFRFHS